MLLCQRKGQAPCPPPPRMLCSRYIETPNYLFYINLITNILTKPSTAVVKYHVIGLPCDVWPSNEEGLHNMGLHGKFPLEI